MISGSDQSKALNLCFSVIESLPLWAWDLTLYSVHTQMEDCQEREGFFFLLPLSLLDLKKKKGKEDIWVNCSLLFMLLR